MSATTTTTILTTTKTPPTTTSSITTATATSAPTTSTPSPTTPTITAIPTTTNNSTPKVNITPAQISVEDVTQESSSNTDELVKRLLEKVDLKDAVIKELTAKIGELAEKCQKGGKESSNKKNFFLTLFGSLW
ncbi:hypothetical protein QR680_011867 [Steinernema hermaphroditum]|uniref:Uncharacterized protein n=1 Tax=Steinernema hermaphroditum TaxID=289476 RepID=A0AA39I008_9BILA|nr:hypothetical protein QR680_011867 [Steinernema hermaphroditum]